MTLMMVMLLIDDNADDGAADDQPNPAQPSPRKAKLGKARQRTARQATQINAITYRQWRNGDLSATNIFVIGIAIASTTITVRHRRHHTL